MEIFSALPVTGEFPAQRPVTLSFDISFDLQLEQTAWKNGWVNNRKAGDLRRHRGHYAVNVMKRCLSYVEAT